VVSKLRRRSAGTCCEQELYACVVPSGLSNARLYLIIFGSAALTARPDLIQQGQISWEVSLRVIVAMNHEQWLKASEKMQQSRRWLGGLAVAGRTGLPVVYPVGGEDVDQVGAVWTEGGIQQGGH
jgi:hypothetical protein